MVAVLPSPAPEHLPAQMDKAGRIRQADLPVDLPAAPRRGRAGGGPPGGPRRAHRARERLPRGRLVCLLALLAASLRGSPTPRGAPPRTGFLFRDEGPLDGASRRAGGKGTLVGSAVVGAMAGHTAVSLMPIVNLIPFTDLLGTLSGALAGALCTQLPRDQSFEGRLGDLCRCAGRATADVGSAAWRLVGG
mmetsp:Transcript_159461/g.487957  ORF Transcript_159461/g.487957 Transcript_159461/m.487957 type:complete len:191 (-) Transcript_159461:131-703(-)